MRTNEGEGDTIIAIQNFGLTHISLALRDLDRAVAFYQHMFGAEEVYRDTASVQLQTPGSKDIIAFELDAALAGQSAGIARFGFRLVKASDIDEAVALALEAGGTLVRRGEFAPGLPYHYENGVQRIQSIAGNLEVEVLRRTIKTLVEFTTISYWESQDAIRRFAGEDINKPHHLPRGAEYLIELPQEIVHYELDFSDLQRVAQCDWRTLEQGD